MRVFHNRVSAAGANTGRSGSRVHVREVSLGLQAPRISGERRQAGVKV